MGLPPMEIDVWWPWSVSCMIFSRKKLNRVGESEHPWRTHTVVLKNSHSEQFKRTALLEFSYSAWMASTSPLSVLKLLCDDSTIEDLFYCAPAWSETGLLVTWHLHPRKHRLSSLWDFATRDRVLQWTRLHNITWDKFTSDRFRFPFSSETF